MWDPTTCQICGDGIGFAVDGSAFCACESCQFPVCRPCYEYERKEGLRGCPNCKAVYRRIRGSPLVDGDADEGPVDIDTEVRELAAAQQRHLEQQQHQPQPAYDGIGRGGGSFVFGVEGEVASQGIPGQDPVGYGTAAAAQQQRFEPAGGVPPPGYGVSPMPPDSAPRTFQGDPETSSSSDYEHSPVRQHGAATVPPGGPLPGMGVPGSYVVPNSASAGYGMPQGGPLVPADSAAAQGNGTIVWKGKTEGWKSEQQKIQLAVGGMPIPRGPGGGDDGPDASMEAAIMDEARQPLSRKEHLPSNLINPYRLVIVLRLIITALFLWWRIENPVEGAFPLWITSIICEIWFAMSWILDQFPKWSPIKRQTFLDRLAMRYEIGPSAAAGLQAGENGPAAGGAGLNQLSPVDIFVSTVDPIKEPAITTCNTLLSILSLDYPADKVACYLSDDGGSMITFDCMAETAEFARTWVPFCKKYRIEPRCPDVYFLQKVDFLKDKVDTTFAVERREMKKQYEEFRVRINQLVSRKMPDDGWVMQDGTPWPGNKSRDHPGMIQVFLGPTGGVAEDGKTLPRMVYVSREKRPGYNHHKKAGAMNSLVRVSAVLTNAPYILNLDCDHYINNCLAVREGMCFMMDPNVGPKACYVQFPQRFDGIDPSDRYANHNTVFFDINLPGLDGVQGPVYVGTGCMFRRAALYGAEPPKKEKKKRTGLCALCCSCFSCCSSCNLCSMCCCCLGCCGSKSGAAGGPGGEGKKGRKKWRKGKKGAKDAAGGMGSAEAIAAVSGAEEAEGMGGPGEETETLQALKQYEGKFGRSPVFVLSTFHEEGGGVVQASPGATLKEAINVISCGYEDRTLWGKEIGWIYGSVTEDILTGFKMHCRGWRSIYCQPRRVAFKGSAPINLSDRLQQVLRWALGSVEIFVSRHCPIWYGWKANKLKVLQRLSYINTSVYPFTSFPLLAYCCLPAICLFVNKFIIPEISGWSIFWFIALFLAIFANGLLEMRWSGVSMTEWWRNEQFWVIGGVSAHLFAVFQGLLKVIVGIDTNFTVTAKQADDGEFAELYIFKWTSLLIPPLFLVIINLLGIVSGTWQAVNSGGSELGSLFGKLFFSLWVILHLWPFVKGLGGRHKQVPTLVIVWSALLASVFSLLWVRVDPWSNAVKGPDEETCGNRC